MECECPSCLYFGEQTVDLAVEDYFYKHGVGENIRDSLLLMSNNKPEDFFDMVSDYIMRAEKIS